MEFEKEIALIQERNKRVEADKAWETSYFRIGLITVITYIVAFIVLYCLGNDKFFLNALVPVIGYLLSAQSIPMVKRRWIKKYLKS